METKDGIFETFSISVISFINDKGVSVEVDETDENWPVTLKMKNESQSEFTIFMSWKAAVKIKKELTKAIDTSISIKRLFK